MSETPWHHAIEPADWAAMTRLHESTHVAASEALGIPVLDVWANPDRDAAHGGQYNNDAGDAQLQSVVYLIGAEGGAQELRDRGYGEGLALDCLTYTGASDRQIVRGVVTEAAAQGYQLDRDRAETDARAVLHSTGFQDAAHNVAEALADRGDQLTGADVRAAMGDFELDGSLWVPAYHQLGHEPAAPEPTPEPGQGFTGPAAPEPDDDLDLDF